MKSIKKPKGLREEKYRVLNIPDTIMKQPQAKVDQVIENIHRVIDEIEVGLGLIANDGIGPVKALENGIQIDTGFRILSLMYYVPSMDGRKKKTEVKEYGTS